MLNPMTLTIPAMIVCAGLSFVPSGNNVSGSGHWISGNEYIYQTREAATFLGESDGVATFETSDGNVWECLVIDPDIQDGETVTLTFENQITREEYVRAEEYGIESETLNSARIIAVD